MLARTILAFGLSLLTVNAVAVPATSELEVRDTSMTDTINSYITLLVKAGFVPNGKAAKRSELDKRDDKPDLNLVLNILAQHGFQPATPKTTTSATTKASSTGHKRETDPALAKRTLPDIALVIALLKKNGFYPSGKATRSVDLSKRQSTSDINTVVNQLVAAGYQAKDFGPNAASLMSSLTLPVETTALCPKDNNTQYSTGGIAYEINCAWDYPGGDLKLTTASTLATCLNACSTFTGTGGPCVAASFGAGNCFLKSAVTHNNHNSGMSAGRNLKYSY